MRDGPFDASNIQTVIEHGSGNVAGIGHAKTDRHLRVCPHEIAKQLADAVITDRVARTDAQLACQRYGFTRRPAPEFGVAFEQLLRQRQQLSPTRVEAQPTPFAVKNGGIQLPLHFGQGHAGGRLGEIQAFRSSAHTSMHGDLNEHLKLAQADVNHQPIL